MSANLKCPWCKAPAKANFNRSGWLSCGHMGIDAIACGVSWICPSCHHAMECMAAIDGETERKQSAEQLKDLMAAKEDVARLTLTDRLEWGEIPTLASFDMGDDDDVEDE